MTLGKALCASSAAAEEPTDALLVADGRRLLLRAIGSDDRDQLAALFARLSPESRYRRFLSPKPEVTSREIERLANVDHTNHEAIGAVDPRDGSVVGVGRYVRYPDRPITADLAVEVADELQNLGIGTALARCVVHRARTNGFALLTATTLWENRPARALLRSLGFRARASRHGVIELELELRPPSVQGYPPLCAHGMSSLDRRYDAGVARLRRG
jgi:acetyltransferase